MASIDFEIVTLDWQLLSADLIGPNEPGLYQVYGTSPLYGRDCLLYIGQAASLAERLRQHLSSTPIARVNCPSVRVARCDRNLLDIAESILVATHKPSMNGEYLHTPKSPEATSRGYLIQNHGDRGALVLQVTNSYWLRLVVLRVSH